MELDTPPARSRFVLTKLILENFKSYAGKVTISRFHSGYTAVVGPNGCGKSNLLEALLFAFGKRASKMRSTRLEELIHKSAEVKALDYASVTIHFASIDGAEETKLNRIILKTGVSHYHINGNPVSFSEVSTYLNDLGIDIEHNRFMILQGEVEMISAMEPKSGYEDDIGTPAGKEGLLEYFDDLIGTRKYHQQLCETERDIIVLQTNVPALNENLTNAKERLEELKNPMVIVVMFIRMKIEMYQLKNVELHFELYEVAQLLKIDEDELSELTNKKDKLKKRYDDLKEKHKNLITEINRLNSELLVKNHEESEERIKFEECNNQHNEEQQKLDSKSKRLKDIQILQENLLRNRSVCESKLGETSEEYRSNEQICEQDKQELSSLQSILKSLREDIQERLQPLQAKLAPLIDNIRRTEENISRIESDRKAEEDKKEYCEATILDVTQTHEQLTEKVKKCNCELREIQNEVSESKAKESELRAEIERVTNESAIAKIHLEESRNSLSEIQHRLEKSKRTVRKTDKRNELQSSIHLAIRSRQLSGVLGRLGDLGEVAPKFDVAISTLYHGQMDSYVATSIEAAERLIEYVREQRNGRITVYSIDKMPEVPNNFQSPHPNAVRIFDQIRILEQYQIVAKVFYRVFRDTLITADVATARSIAFELGKRWDVATYAGEIIRKTGDMQGFAQTRTGSIRLMERGMTEAEEENVEELEGEVRKWTKTVEEHAERDSRIQNELMMLQRNLQELEIQDIHRRNKKEMLEREVKKMNKELKTLPDTAENRAAIETIAEKITQIDIQLQQPKKTLLGLNLKRNRQKAKIDALKSKEFLEMEEKEIHLLQCLNQGEIRSIKLMAEIRNRKIKLINLAAENDTNDEKIASFNKDIENSNKLLFEIIAKAGKLMETVNKLVMEQKEISDQLAEKEEQQPEVSKQFDRIHHKIQSVQSKIKAVEALRNTKLAKSEKIMVEVKGNRSNHNADVEHYSALIEGLSLGDPKESDTDFFSLEPKRFKAGDEVKYLVNVNEFIDINSFVENIDSETHSKSIIQNKDKVEKRIANLAENLKQEPQWEVVSDFRQVSERIKMLQNDINQIYIQLSANRKMYFDLRNERLSKFKYGFDTINENLKKIYSKFTVTGVAEIEFLDAADPYSEGINISVRPPGKSWKRLSGLSGGEKTLVSLSLIFALHDYKPNSIYLMDEIDASLDFINVQKVADYIRLRKSTAQFIIVSLRCQMFEVADELIGVFKHKDRTEVIALCPRSLDLQPGDSSNVIITNSLSS